MKKKINDDPPPFQNYDHANDLKDIKELIDNDIFSSEQSDNKDYIFETKKSGLLFPSVTVISAVIISSLIILISNMIFNSEINNINLKISDKIKLESALMSKFKTDTDQKIRNKDIKINRIQDKLDNYNEQLETLRKIIFAKNMGQEITDTEGTSEYSGKSIAEIEKTIKDISDKKAQEEKNLFIEINEKDEFIREADEIKTVAQNENSDIDVISEIQIKLEQQNLINSQLYVIYENIFSSINEGDYNKTREYIQNFKTLLYIESNKDLPEIDDKRKIYKNTLQIIEEYILIKETNEAETNFKFTKSAAITELNTIYSKIIYNMESRNFNSALNSIKKMKYLLNLSSEIETPELTSKKREYKRTLSVLEEYISLHINFNKRMDSENQKNSKTNDESGKNDDAIIKENTYTDYYGKTAVFGKIALKDNQVIIIEPFFDITVRKGDSFLIKKDNTEIAGGVILSSSEASARGKITVLKDSEIIPEIDNLVYIITE